MDARLQIVKELEEFCREPRGWWDAARQEESIEPDTTHGSIECL